MIFSPTTENISQLAAEIRRGKCVAFPTETVYGLGADATNGAAIAQIFSIKQRPSFNPLIVHVPDLSAAKKIGVFNHHALALAERFWPGPLTLVVPRQPECQISDLVSAGLPTIALRVPANPLARAFIEQAGCPIAAPSANKSGTLSPTKAQHVQETLPDISILDGDMEGNAAEIGLESTIIGCLSETPTLLRLGGLASEEIEAYLGCKISQLPESDDTEDATGAKLAPGRLLKHYAPQAALRLNATHVEHGEALLAFGKPLAHDGPTINLSETRNLNEAATRLFAALHELDGKGNKIAVMPIPENGLGAAINDRLSRAAQGR